MRTTKYRAIYKPEHGIPKMFDVHQLEWLSDDSLIVNGEIPSWALDIVEYTGCQDIKGADIYEGDVVKRACLDDNCPLEHRGVVVYSQKWSMWGIDEGRMRAGDYPAPLSYGSPQQNMIIGVEKLGNVYETPTLMDNDVQQ